MQVGGEGAETLGPSGLLSGVGGRKSAGWPHWRRGVPAWSEERGRLVAPSSAVQLRLRPDRSGTAPTGPGAAGSGSSGPCRSSISARSAPPGPPASSSQLPPGTGGTGARRVEGPWLRCCPPAGVCTSSEMIIFSKAATSARIPASRGSGAPVPGGNPLRGSSCC